MGEGLAKKVLGEMRTAMGYGQEREAAEEEAAEEEKGRNYRDRT